MFHQVFICDTSQEPEFSGEVTTEDSNENADEQAQNHETNPLETTEMDAVKAEKSEIAERELKMEQCNVIINPVGLDVNKEGLKEEDLVPQDFQEVVTPSNDIEISASETPLEDVMQTEQLKIALKELKMEKLNIINNHGVKAINEESMEEDLIPKDIQDIVAPVDEAAKTNILSGMTNVLPEDLMLTIKELKAEKINMTNNHGGLSCQKQEVEDDILPSDLDFRSEFVDCEVQDIMAKPQEDNGLTNLKTLSELIHSDTKINLRMALTKDTFKGFPNINNILDNSESQKNVNIKNENVNDCRLKKLYNIKECNVVINKYNLEGVVPDLINLNNKIRNRSQPASIESDDSCCSDWEEEYQLECLTKKSKQQFQRGRKNTRKKIESSNSIVKGQNYNQSIKKNSNLSYENSDPKRKEVLEANENKLYCSNTLDIREESVYCAPYYRQENVSVNDPSQLDLHSIKGLPNNRQSSSLKSKKDNSGNYLFQLILDPSFKGTLPHNLTLKFIPTNSILANPTIRVQAQQNNVTNVKGIKTQPTESEIIKDLNVQKSTEISDMTLVHPTKNKKAKRKNVQTSRNKTKINPSHLSGDEFMNDASIKVSIEKNKESSIQKEKILSTDLFQCKTCDKIFDGKKQYSSHCKYSLCSGYRRQLKNQCDICGKLFTGLEKLQNHKNSHTNARPFKCSDCDKYFNSKGARHMHLKKMHLNKKICYLCSFCGITSPSISHLLAHEETHRLPEGAEIPLPFKCLHCGKGFISKFKLQKHQKEHRPKKCSVCHETFPTQTRLQYHKEDVHGIVKTHKCEECGKHFKCRNTLRSHFQVHSTILSFFCDICDKGFKIKAHLVQHMISHSDERPISCPECSETFKRITHLKQHTAAFHGKGRKH